MSLRPACPGTTNMFALLRLLPMSDRDKVVEILALWHRITVPGTATRRRPSAVLPR